MKLNSDLYKIIIFSYLVAFFIQYLADSGLKKIDESIYADWNKILDGSINSDLVILGSSRGYVSYDPRIIQQATGLSAYNLSINAGPYNIQALKFESYLNNNKYPKVIVQNIDLNHFSKSKVLPEEYQFLPYLNNKQLITQLSEFDTNYSWNHYLPLFKYNKFKSFLTKGLLSFFGKQYSISPTFHGYAPKNPSFKIDEHNLKRLRELQTDSSNIEKYRNKLIIMKEFLKEYKSNSLTIFLVWAPEYKERLVINTSITIPLKEDINELVSGMQGVYFLDFSNDPLNMKEEYFYDTFHLNEKGSALFSAKLAIEINSILKN